MGRKGPTGLRLRCGVWHIDKRLKEAPGGRLRESTGFAAGELPAAERYLARRIDEIRQAAIYGVRPRRTFEKAAAKYLEWNEGKASILDDGMHLEQLIPYIGERGLEQVHMGTLQPFIKARQEAGIKTKSVNLALGVVRHLLNQAASEWIDEYGLTWLQAAPKIKLLRVTDAAQPYPLSWEEQDRLIKELPGHLARMALYKVNTGTREQEVCGLRWEWEVSVPELDTSVFLIPAMAVKNREERLVVHNRIAASIIKGQRGKHKELVFPYEDRRITCMNNTAWKRAWRKAGLPTGKEYRRGVHNLKHTFGRRLRAAGVHLETRRVLLGHRNGDITTHYSQAELAELIEAANRVCGGTVHKMPTLTVLKRKSG